MTPHSQVFLVDDDPSVRRAIERLLRSAGYGVQAFASAQEIRRTLDEDGDDGPACLLLDVRMPGHTGFDLFEWVRSSGRDIPVIFMTGDVDTSLAARAMKAGAVEYLAKPFDDEALLEAIRKALALLEVHRQPG
ncbi:MAG TPA: response regulator [Vicinamibacterales bacterium]|nr:response regulator [Vicinamibacterales bacterium]